MTTQTQARGATDPPRLSAQFEPISITIEGIDPDQLMTAGVDTRANDYWPTFSTGELGKVFFGLTAHWVRDREDLGRFGRVVPGDGDYLRVYAPDGTEIGQRTEKGARSYSLADVERIVHALLFAGSLTPELAVDALFIVKSRMDIAQRRTAAAQRPAQDQEPAADLD